MKFSVLMPVYIKENPKYLQESLESVLNQTYAANEIVLVKDGALTNELDSIIEKYKLENNKSFKVIEIEENVGLGKALNIGLKHCSNEIVARMDSDDICVKDRFEKQIKVFENNEDVHLVGSYISEFTTDKEVIENIRTVPINYEEIIKYSKRRNPLNHMTVMYKRDAVLDSGNYQESYLTEDYNLWVRMLAKGYKAINIPESLVMARCNKDTYKRRGGIRYIKSEYSLQRKFLKMKYINFYEFVRNLIIRTTVRIMPNLIREKIYNSLLRSKVRNS